MIKGKRIGDVNLKVVTPAKSTQKAVGVPLGKFYIPEKTDFAHQNQIKQCENEEDHQFEKERCRNQCNLNNKNEDNTSLKITQPQNNTKSNPAFQNDAAKKDQQTKDNTKKKLEKYITRKQNKNVNNGNKKGIRTQKQPQQKQNDKRQNRQPTPHPKTINHSQFKPGLTPSIKVKQISKENQEVGLTQDLQDITKTKANQLKQIYQEEQQLDQEDQIEQEREYLPHPYAQQVQGELLFQGQEISFQNDAFQLRMEKEPLQYESSEQEDSEDDNYNCYNLRFSQNQAKGKHGILTKIDSISSSQQISLNINSELFSLSAQQLLAKEYFNV